MRELHFLVPPAFDGVKLKSFLRGPCKLSNRLMTRQKWVFNGITVNGVHAYVTKIVHTGDQVCVRLPDVQQEIPAIPMPLEIVWEDEDLLVVNKPPYMPVYPTPGHDHDSLANAVAAHCQENRAPFSFHPVYRLDKNTSGLLVLAKHSYGASVLASGVEKEYLAVCEGVLHGQGTISAPIRLKQGHGIQREVGEEENAQAAVTHWKAVAPCDDGGHTWLKIRLETGRTHQIRVHFSHFGHPLAGDDLYGGSRRLIQRQALLCHLAQFSHPVTHELLTFQIPLPSDFIQAFGNFPVLTKPEHS